MQITVTLGGNTVAEKWATAKVACKAAMASAVEKAVKKASEIKKISGQRVEGFNVPDGEKFCGVFVTTEGINGYSIVSGYHASDNVNLPVEENWSCSLSGLVEFTLALSVWEPVQVDD